MKSGETRFIVKKLDTKKPYNSVGFRLSNGKTTIKKSTDAEDTKDKVLVQDGVFLIPLQQADTNALQGNVTLEAQINYTDHSVIMSDDNFLYINSSLGYDAIQGSAPAEDDGIEVVMTAIEEGVAVIVNPEASQELIDAVTGLFQDTKQIAQSVRDDADNGEFDGTDGYSPQVTVKTETPSTYVLHIKDADHEFDTPNLQGQGGEGSIEVGDGLQKVGNVVSVALKDGESVLGFDNGKLKSDLSAYYTKSESDNRYNAKLTVGNGIDITSDTISVKKTGNFLTFVNNGLTVDTSVLGTSNSLRQSLVDDTDINPLASKGYTDTELAKKQNTINTQNKLSATLVETNQYNTFVTLDEKQSWTDKQDKLTAGTNITIDSNNVISASGGGLSYTFTNGLTESSGTVGIDLKSGTELQITDGELDIDLSDYATQTDLSSKQDTIDTTHKLSADLVDDTNSSNKFVSAQEKQGWNDKADETDISTDTTSTTVSLTLADNHEYRYTQELTSLTLTMPSGDFISSIVFASGSTPTSMTYDSSIKWSGDDVTNGQFVPTEKTYNIVMWYDGINVNGVVRGVA